MTLSAVIADWPDGFTDMRDAAAGLSALRGWMDGRVRSLDHWISAYSEIPFFNDLPRRMQLGPPSSGQLYWPLPAVLASAPLQAFVECGLSTHRDRDQWVSVESGRHPSLTMPPVQGATDDPIATMAREQLLGIEGAGGVGGDPYRRAVSTAAGGKDRLWAVVVDPSTATADPAGTHALVRAHATAAAFAAAYTDLAGSTTSRKAQEWRKEAAAASSFAAACESVLGPSTARWVPSVRQHVADAQRSTTPQPITTPRRGNRWD